MYGPEAITTVSSYDGASNAVIGRIKPDCKKYIHHKLPKKRYIYIKRRKPTVIIRNVHETVTHPTTTGDLSIRSVIIRY